MFVSKKSTRATELRLACCSSHGTSFRPERTADKPRFFDRNIPEINRVSLLLQRKQQTVTGADEKMSGFKQKF